MPGIEVSLYDNDLNSFAAVTTTDKNGNYGFKHLNPLHQYRVMYKYNGMQYLMEPYHADISDTNDSTRKAVNARETISGADSADYYSNIKDNPTNSGTFETANLSTFNRDKVNERFTRIDAADSSFTDKSGKNAKAFGFASKLRASDSTYLKEGGNFSNKILNTDGDYYRDAIRYCDAYNRFQEIATNTNEFKVNGGVNEFNASYLDLTTDPMGLAQNGDFNYKSKLDSLKGELDSAGVGESDKVKNYLENTLVTSLTDYYPYHSKTRYWLEDPGLKSDDSHENYQHTDGDPVAVNGQIYIDPLKASEKSYVYQMYNSDTSFTNKRAGDNNKYDNIDQARHVNTIVRRRINSNIAISSDITDVTLKINGQIHRYDYSSIKAGGYFTGGSKDHPYYKVKVESKLQNGEESYQRAITESQYLFHGNSMYGDNNNNRNLDVYITYEVCVFNYGNTELDLNEVACYYDQFYMEYDPNDPLTNNPVDQDGHEISNHQHTTLTVNDNSVITGSHSDALTQTVGPSDATNMYKAKYLTNFKINGAYGDSAENNTNPTILQPNAVALGTITFKQTKDSFDRIHINQDLESGNLLRPGMCVFEVNSYSTDPGASNTSETRGIVTQNSVVGSLEKEDFYDNTKTQNVSMYGHVVASTDETQNRFEDDTSQAPNLAIFVPKEAQKTSISGYTFEDVRNKDSGKAVIGNGLFKGDSDKDKKDSSDKDKKINGVTVQLIELVKNVDEKGYPTSYYSANNSDYYTKEKIWDTCTYKLTDDHQTGDWHNLNSRDPSLSREFVPNDNTTEQNGVNRYYSGSGKSRVILNVEKGDASNSYLYTEEENTDLGNGEYKFTNIPPGNFMIRFIYGDTTQTVLVNNPNDDVNKLLASSRTVTSEAQNQNPNRDKRSTQRDHNLPNYGFVVGSNNKYAGFFDTVGLNAKSYNGQDYKSTIYQNGVSQDTANKTDSKIAGFKNYTKQNYSDEKLIKMMYPNSDGSNNDEIKSTLYNYDIPLGDDANLQNVSDAKDIDAFRENSNNYAKGYINNSLDQDGKYDTQKSQNTALLTNTDNNYKYNGDSNLSPITLRNYRNEVLKSFKEIGTYSTGSISGANLNRIQNLESGGFNEEQAIQQMHMIEELMTNTKMVAQTGVIDINTEYNSNYTAFNKDVMILETENYIRKKTPDGLVNTSNVENYTKQHIKDVDLGLTERPEAQLKLTKKVSNLRIALSNGETLFDANKSINNLYFGQHKEHSYKYNNKTRLVSVTRTSNKSTTPELIQGYMDDELIAGYTLEITLEFKVENIGEVDYLDKQFYYTGNPISTEEWNISRTNADEIIDYVSNKINFVKQQNEQLDDLVVKGNGTGLTLKTKYPTWDAKSLAPKASITSNVGSKDKDGLYLYNYIYPFGISSNDKNRTGNNKIDIAEDNTNNLNADLVNREYSPDLATYTTLITTDSLSTSKYVQNAEFQSKQNISKRDLDGNNNGDTFAYTYGLLPKAADVDESKYSTKTQLKLSKVLATSSDDQLVFPNLTEIVRMSNSVGRRCEYSTVGNQPVANQNLGKDVDRIDREGEYEKYSRYTPVDTVTPLEIDADSSQSVRILPPTGLNKNNTLWFASIIGGLAIIIVSIYIIKSGLDVNKKKRRTKDIKRWK